MGEAGPGNVIAIYLGHALNGCLASTSRSLSSEEFLDSREAIAIARLCVVKRRRWIFADRRALEEEEEEEDDQLKC